MEIDKKDKSSPLWMIRFLHGIKRYFITALIAAAFAIIFNFLIPQVVRFTVDSVISGEALKLPEFLSGSVESLRDLSIKSILVLCGIFILLFSLLSGLFDFISRINLSKGTEGFSKNLRDSLFSHIQSLSFKWHTDNITGDIIQRCTSDVETVKEFISKHLIEVCRTMLLIVTAMTLMLSMNFKLAIISLSVIPVIVLYSMLFYGRIGKQFLIADQAEGELLTAVQENLTGVRVVRAFGCEAYEYEKFEKKLNTFTKFWIDLGYTLGLFWGIGDLATGAQILIVVCFGTYFAVNGEMTLGELLAFIGYAQTISWPVRTLGRTLSELSKADVSITRIHEIFEAEPETNEGKLFEKSLYGDIEFKDVSFSYKDKMVLSNLSFKIEKGSTFGILGATGSGKSTIAYLINRLYSLPDDFGTITIGGTDIREFKLSYLRQGVGLVLQEPFLFSKTIGENIAIASPVKELEYIRRAARTSAIDDNIMEFNQGYNTMVGERGVTLSGGQKQRIAIARTLMTGAPIMIFDDSMSAIDMETDEKIRKALKENTKGATVIIISHRVNTLMQADKIMVLENGTAAQIGTHEELILQEGAYQRVYKMQSDASIIKPEEGSACG